ncbi:HD-GYP domain-containing protein [Streptomyces sp. NPDC127084]|uniref:HD-GYP domain-containing protein n=1 Tax=Streptomyces sp. NPDC127084 TaxID=3347133 RepID=UPI003646A013
MRGIPGRARALILCAVVCAVASVLPALRPGAQVPWTDLAVLAGAYAVGELPLRRFLGPAGLMGPSGHVGHLGHVDPLGLLRGRPAEGSPSAGAGSFFPVLLAAALVLPPPAAALAAIPGALAAPVDRTPVGARRVWRAAELALATWAASWAAVLSGGLGTAPAFPRVLPVALASVLAFCLVLTALDAAILAGAERSPPATTWYGLLPGSLAPHLVHGLAAVMAAVLWHSAYGPVSALFVLLPVYISSWVFAEYHHERGTHRATIRALVQAVDIKDEYTRGHSERVGRASVLIACELGMDEERLEVIRFAGILHDVGKLGVPTRVLRKDGPLTPDERRVIELHPEYGHEMVRGIGFLGDARAAILHHHERIDGSGYPYGLAGDQIPESARVVAVADAFDAMTSSRSYSRARPVAEAVEELERCAGTHFDPRMVRALVNALSRHGWRTEVTADEPHPPGAPPTRLPQPRGAAPPVRTAADGQGT